MLKSELLNLATKYISDTYYNKIGPHTPNAEGYYGFHIFDDPIVGVASAEDPYWKELLKPEAVGPHFMLPDQWLQGAKSVVCFFLPISSQLKEYGKMSSEKIRKEWLFARTDAQWVLMTMCEHIVAALEKEGYNCVIPQYDERYVIRSGLRHEPNEIHISDNALSQNNAYKGYKLDSKPKQVQTYFPTYSSNWSERHVGFTSGLGTFGLSANLITRVGTAGRLVSFVTNWDCNEYNKRSYTNIYEYCIKCGACIDRCPGHSISFEFGKDKTKCHEYYESIGYYYVPRYHCGTCLTGIPCQDAIPNNGEIKND